MLRVYGVPLDEAAVRRIIATLLVENTPAAPRAAEQLTKGVERELYAIGLAPDERDAGLAVLACEPDTEGHSDVMHKGKSPIPVRAPLLERAAPVMVFSGGLSG
jgi:hypothetical protein